MTPEEAALEVIRQLINHPDTNEASRRELFIGHLSSLFPDYSWQISEYALGAERPIRTPGLEGRGPTTGRIDTRKGALLVEYKSNLSALDQQREAEKKLSEYVAGIVNEEGLTAVSKCISTDILRWRDFKVLIRPGAAKGTVTPEQVVLNQISDSKFSETNPGLFVQVVKRLIFEDVPLVATARLLVDLFGLDSRRFSEFYSRLKTDWAIHRKSPEAQLGISLWSEYIENCFDKSVIPNEDSYLNHVYLVILARMISALALTTSSLNSAEDFPKKALTGEFFSAGVHRVDHFVEEDFFRWVKTDSSLNVLRSALQDLYGDLQKLDFRSARKFNLLSALYQQIMPPDTRAEYGEVFTPTWLCRRIIKNLQRCGEPGIKVLDPACGTGGFLRVFIEKKLKKVPKQWNHQQILESILADICGLDINPVSIIIAKTTVMLCLAEYLRNSDKPVEIPIYLCDSLFLPKGLVSKKGDESTVVSFDGVDLEFPAKIFADGISRFDEIVDNADRLAMFLASGELSVASCKKTLREATNRIAKEIGLPQQLVELLYKSSTLLVFELAKRIKERRNRVWSFVLKNTYKPSFLKARFDVIVCNPPWLAMSSFPAARYKDQLESLIDTYGLTPRAASKHHLEISTVFAVHCVSHYLKPQGIFGFVLPRVILTGDHHDPFRRSGFRGRAPFKITQAFDFYDVSPLFGRPACAIFGEQNASNAGFPAKLPVVEFGGDPREGLAEVVGHLTLSILGRKSSFETKVSGVNEDKGYWAVFRQGADLMPRQAVIVDIIGNKQASALSIQTSSAEKMNPNNKPPWNEIDLSGLLESRFMFTTLKSDAVLPFLVGQYSYAALPIEKFNTRYRLLDQEEFILRNYPRASKWFEDVDKELLRLGQKKLNSWLERKNKLIDQPSESTPHLVIYGAGGTNVCSAIVNTSKAEFPFVNDQTLYAWQAPSEEEAWYVCGLLNSDSINKAIKGYQPRGLFGEQHVHKLPLSLIPKFDKSDYRHVKLAEESKRIAQVASRLCDTDKRYLDVSRSLASRRRLFLRKLAPELEKLNKLAKEIVSEE